MTDLTRKIETIQREIEERRLLERASSPSVALNPEEIALYKDPKTAAEIAPIPRRTRGFTNLKLVEQTQDWLLRQEQLGLFSSILVVPGNEFPTLLGRLPIFPPIPRRRQKTMLDADGAYPFETPFGWGRRFGGLTNTDDEDFLIGMMHLRSRRLTGLAQGLPIKTRHIVGTQDNGQMHVHAAVFTVSQLLAELGYAKSSDNYRTALASIRRINAVVVELETTKHERYFGKSGTRSRGSSFKLIDVAWDVFKNSGVIYVQFSPIVVSWLENEFTYVNFEVRKKLGTLEARALHRFLSTQPHEYENLASKVAESIGIRATNAIIRRKLQKALDDMKAISWLDESSRITGTGRASPYVLISSRAKSPK